MTANFTRKILNIIKELKVHAPFTFFGAVVGLLCMFAVRDISHQDSLRLFKVFHPLHVVLSAMVTAGLFRICDRKKHFLTVLLIGYFGSIGVATLSDSIIPFFGESILGVTFPAHEHMHEDSEEHSEECDHENTNTLMHDGHEHSILSRLHLGFIEEWWAVTPAALLGVFIAYFLPHSKFPHAAHVLISTWASSAHILMNMDRSFTFPLTIGLLVVLFMSVWLPCCISDIVFPLLFVKNENITKHIHDTHEH